MFHNIYFHEGAFIFSQSVNHLHRSDEMNGCREYIYIQPMHLVTAADLDEFIFLVFGGMLGVNCTTLRKSTQIER